jgi:hypothetical protein
MCGTLGPAGEKLRRTASDDKRDTLLSHVSSLIRIQVYIGRYVWRDMYREKCMERSV